MTDPLSLLRQYNLNKKPITQENDHIIFGEYKWPKTVKTKYLVKKPKKDKTTKEYYTLESLLYFLRNASLFHPDYFRKAAAENIPHVRRPDRKKLLAYLNGENDASPNIDENAPSEIPTSGNATVKHEPDDQNQREVEIPISGNETVKHEPEDQNQREVIKKPRLEYQDNETCLPRKIQNTDEKGISLQYKQERDQPAA